MYFYSKGICDEWQSLTGWNRRYLSEPVVVHNSAWSCELLAHAISTIAQHFHLELHKCDVRIHGDNSSKELKNNSCLRWLSELVSSHRIRSGCVATLQAGHSHEYIDATFGLLAAHLAGYSELHVPQDYIRALDEWLLQPKLRPRESLKMVRKVDRVRDWCLVAT